MVQTPEGVTLYVVTGMLDIVVTWLNQQYYLAIKNLTARHLNESTVVF